MDDKTLRAYHEIFTDAWRLLKGHKQRGETDESWNLTMRAAGAISAKYRPCGMEQQASKLVMAALNVLDYDSRQRDGQGLDGAETSEPRQKRLEAP